METYILTTSMHLGFANESFPKGSVIQFDPSSRKLLVGGRHFDDYRDIEILKRQSRQHPDQPWIVEYSDESLDQIAEGRDVDGSPAFPKRDSNSDGIMVVISDEDSHPTIDISHTKISSIAQREKEAERNRSKTQELPVIKGEESVEERLASLKSADNTDIGARAERVKLMAERKAVMPIVRDDSLGAGVSSGEIPLNAGTIVGGRRAEEAPDAATAAAAARKAEADSRRPAVLTERIASREAEVAGAFATSTGAVVEFDKDAEIEALRASIKEEAESVPDPRDEEIAKLRAELDSVRSKSKKHPVLSR